MKLLPPLVARARVHARRFPPSFWLLAVAGGMGLIGAPLGGILTDRVGRRPTLLVGLAGGAIGFLAYGTLSNLLAVAVVTSLFGFSSDLESPAVSAAIA